jgi:hypothetical protein
MLRAPARDGHLHTIGHEGARDREPDAARSSRD